MTSSMPDPNPTAESARNPRSRRSITIPMVFFIAGFVVMLVGLFIQYNPVAGLGFVSMVIAFIYLNYRLFLRYSRTSLRRFTDSVRRIKTGRFDSRSTRP